MNRLNEAGLESGHARVGILLEADGVQRSA
jgi:hypothetical protein